MFAFVLVCHVLAAIGVGPILTLPLLANAPAASRAVLVVLRFGAAVTLVSGIVLWVVLRPDNAVWLYVSLALFLLVAATIVLVIEPAVKAVSQTPDLRRRIRFGGIAASGLTLGIGALMVLRPN